MEEECQKKRNKISTNARLPFHKRILSLTKFRQQSSDYILTATNNHQHIKALFDIGNLLYFVLLLFDVRKVRAAQRK